MLEMTVEKINPKKAKEYMRKNVNNPRGTNSLSRSHVKELADDMAAGLWQLNAEPIVFDEDGFLKNGQHRLAAVMMSGVTIEVVVIRGVSRDVDIWDVTLRRTINQMVKANGHGDSNPSIASAGSLIVNNFGPNRGLKVREQYVDRHYNEFERAYRVACYGGQGSPKSKCAPCIAATYLALRTESIPSYELELFFRIFNAKNNYQSDGYDASPAVIARQMFDDRVSSGYQIQKEKLEIIVLALQDFHNAVHRSENYRIAEPFHYSEWMDDIRRKDGLE